MNGRKWQVAVAATAMAGFGLYAAPVAAQTGSMTRTWVSGTGNDGNACTTQSPCLTFNGALAKTAPGGEVNCLTAGGYGPMSITASVSIVCNNVEAGIIATSSTAQTSAVVINGAGAVVTLSGLDLDGFNSGVNGVQVTAATSVVLDGVKVRNFTGFGIRFEPAAAASLTIKKATVTGNGASGTTSGGIYVHPAAGGSVVLADSLIANNVNVGARIESMSGSAINATVLGVVATNNNAGLLFRAPAGSINGTLNGSTLTNNAGYGLIANGSTTLAVGDTTVVANGTGLYPIGAAALTSFGDNRVTGNTNNGSFSGTQVKQ